MNRLALHESVAASLTTAELVDVAAQAGFDSIGLRVAGVPGAAGRWEMGVATPALRETIDRLLVTRVSVLDIGRAELRGDIDPDLLVQSHRSVLDLGVRLGAHWATATAVGSDLSEADIQALFATFVAECAAYSLVPLLVGQPHTAVADTASAVGVVQRVGTGGVVVEISIGQDAGEIESTVVDSGNSVGYLRLLADELDEAEPAGVAGLLATVPPHIPIAVGAISARAAESGPDLADRARKWRDTIDQMLEHPRARAARLGS